MNVGGDEVVVEIEMTGLTPEDAIGTGGVPSKAEGRRRGRESQLEKSRRDAEGELTVPVPKRARSRVENRGP